MNMIKRQKIRRWIAGHIWLLKASFVSQISAWVDFGLSFASFAWLGLNASYSAATGAIGGGIVNCSLNYKWTFRAGNCPVINVAIKYAMVWIGSLLLNTYGTAMFTALFVNSETLDSWHVATNLRFTVARLGVSLIVSVGWNLLLQRIFVYRNVKFDRVLNNLTHHPSA